VVEDLVTLVSLFANAQTGHSGKLAEQSGVLTYTESVLHTFTGSPDGGHPDSSLVADSAGNLYGVTYYGGIYCVGYGGCGTVFELSPDGNGGWTYNVIYSFTGSADATSLTIDSQGNLYVTGDMLAGDLFELCPEPNGGGWVLCNEYDFTGGSDGQAPHGPVIVDSSGNVYVAMQNDDDGQGNGTVDELVLEQGVNGGGPFWVEQTLYTFTGGNDGDYPHGSLVMDKAGNLYGITYWGGSYGFGVVFKLHRTAKGTWKESVLYSFGPNPDIGYEPGGPLIFDKAGNLYGTTHLSIQNGNYGSGGVYKLTPSGQITSLYQFTGTSDPASGLVFDKAGNLYGMAFGGTANCSGEGCGVVYELTPPADGQTTTWTENVLYSFTGGADGAETPRVDAGPGTPIFDSAGDLYGTTWDGGKNYYPYGFGVVYKLAPNPVATTTTITKNAPNPSTTGQVVTVSFTVTQTVKANSQPTGTVTVNASTGESCEAALPANGKANCKLLIVTAGTRTLTATYSGDTADLSSVSGAVTQSTFNSTSTTIAKHTPDPAKVGQAVTVHFTVDAKNGTKHTEPTGSVTVTASTGETCMGTLSAGGTGRCQLTFSSVEITTLTATYTGDANNEGSVSKAVEQAVE
jgi:uncharacterized repeat protein (TIGR03803 family)